MGLKEVRELKKTNPRWGPPHWSQVCKGQHILVWTSKKEQISDVYIVEKLQDIPQTYVESIRLTGPKEHIGKRCWNLRSSIIKIIPEKELKDYGVELAMPLARKDIVLSRAFSKDKARRYKILGESEEPGWVRVECLEEGYEGERTEILRANILRKL